MFMEEYIWGGGDISLTVCMFETENYWMNFDANWNAMTFETTASLYFLKSRIR
jgi:hypothetical protein